MAVEGIDPYLLEKSALKVYFCKKLDMALNESCYFSWLQRI